MLIDNKSNSPPFASVINNPTAVAKSDGQGSRPHKRQGSHNSIYPTPEDRRRRNRQAQAVFRERRRAYIRRLEHVVRIHEATLLDLQKANRTTNHECLKLRYRNSVLERVLLEKGSSKTYSPKRVDLPTELRTETSNAALYSTYMPQNIGQPPLMAGHHQPQPQLSTPRIAPNIGHSTTHPPSHASTASPSSPTATQLTSPAMHENIARGGQHPGTSRQEIASVQSIQQPVQHCSPPQLPAASEFSFHTTPGFQNHTVQLDHYARADLTDSFDRVTLGIPGVYTGTLQ